MALTAQQEFFCRQYVVQHFNATDAYRTAYPKSKPSSARAAAARLLANVSVSDRVAALARQSAAEEGITPARVIRELGFVAFQRKSQIFRPDGTLKSPCEWDEATDATIAGIETEEEYTAEGEEQEPQPHGGTLKRNRGQIRATRTLKVKRWDKVKALELFMKHFGLLKEEAPYPDRVIVDLKVMTDDALEKLLTALGPLLPPQLRALGNP